MQEKENVEEAIAEESSDCRATPTSTEVQCSRSSHLRLSECAGGRIPFRVGPKRQCACSAFIMYSRFCFSYAGAKGVCSSLQDISPFAFFSLLLVLSVFGEWAPFLVSFFAMGEFLTPLGKPGLIQCGGPRLKTIVMVVLVLMLMTTYE